MSRLIIAVRFAHHSATPALAVRNAADVIEPDRIVRESYGPDCWIDRGQGAEISLGHDTEAIGRVVVVAAHGDYWYADGEIESDDPETLAQIKVGAPISLGARSLECDEDLHLGLRRHRRCLLEHLAIVRRERGERPAFPDAMITAVREVASRAKPAASAGGWRSKLPASHREFADMSDETVLGGMIFTNGRGSIRWDGEGFVAVGDRLAA